MTTAELFTSYRRDDGVEVIGRESFCRDYFDYQPGEHVVFGGHTTGGKTTLAFDLLQYCATPDLPAYVGVSKPRDPTTERAAVRLGFRRVTTWPPPPQLKEILTNHKASGYIVTSKFGDINADVTKNAKVIADLIDDRYAAGAKGKQGILVMDDTMVKAKVLGLDRKMVTILTMAAAMGLGIWVMVQKPTDSGQTAIWAYTQSEHMFIAKDKDSRVRARYDEIGGMDPKLVTRVVGTLEPYQFLYLKQTGGFMCIVGAK